MKELNIWIEGKRKKVGKSTQKNNMPTNSCSNYSPRLQDCANPARILWELVPVIFSHCLRHKEKCRWVATTNERSMSRTIVPARIIRIDNGGEEGQGNRWRTCSIESAVFLSPCERSTWGWMRSLIWGKLQGVTDRDPLFSVYFRRIAQNVIPRLWWRSMRALERSALSLTNCLRFVIGPSKAFRASILDLPCLTRWKVEEDKQLVVH